MSRRGRDRPPEWREAHHLVPWASGGATSIDNTAVVCGYHHTLLHQGEWTARMIDGVLGLARVGSRSASAALSEYHHAMTRGLPPAAALASVTAVDPFRRPFVCLGWGG